MVVKAMFNSTPIAKRSRRDSSPLEEGAASCSRTRWSMILSTIARTTGHRSGAVSTELPTHAPTMTWLGKQGGWTFSNRRHITATGTAEERLHDGGWGGHKAPAPDPFMVHPRDSHLTPRGEGHHPPYHN